MFVTVFQTKHNWILDVYAFSKKIKLYSRNSTKRKCVYYKIFLQITNVCDVPGIRGM